MRSIRLTIPVSMVAALSMGACALQEAPDLESRGGQAADAPAPFVTVGYFVGSFDPSSGMLSLRSSTGAEVLAASEATTDGMRTSAHPLYCEQRVTTGAPDTVSVDTIDGTVATTAAGCGYSGFPYETLGMFCADVRVASHRPTSTIYDATAEIAYVDPPEFVGYEHPLGNGADVDSYPNGPGRPVSAAGGAFPHGDLGPGESADAQWTFRNPGGAFRFGGRIVARVEELANGIDDNCDGRIDDRLGLYTDGAACWVDEDCLSGSCHDRVEGVGDCAETCAEGRHGDPCADCPGGAGAAQCHGHGTCADGAGGSGACACDPGYAGDCDVCTPGYYEAGGGTCAPCPTCENGGSCVETGPGAGGCACPTGHHGSTCQHSCSDGVAGGDETGVDCGGPCGPCPSVVCGPTLSSGQDGVCAMLVGRTLRCWGGNWNGQLGLGDVEIRSDEPGEMGAALSPVALGDGRTLVGIEAGGAHACALFDLGRVTCWGYNAYGQLGAGNTAQRGDGPGEMGNALTIVDLGSGRSALSITAGWSHTCALLDDGSVKCWGYNSFGQLGQGDTGFRGDRPGELGDALPPIDLGTGRTATAIEAGLDHTCALLDDRSVKCWGWNHYGQLGLGDRDTRGDQSGEMGDALLPIDLGTGRTATAITAGGALSCALLDDGTVKCWGLRDRGDGPGEMGDALPVSPVGAGRTAVAITAGIRHACALLDDGSLRCWGTNTAGQLGLGDRTDRSLYSAVPPIDLGAGRTATAVTAWWAHTCARLDTGAVKCWGGGVYGQLGQGDTANRGDDPGEMGDDLPTVPLDGLVIETTCAG